MPKPDRSAPSTTYSISGVVVDGTVRLTGDIRNDVVEVTAGENAVVVIADDPQWYFYAVVTPADGATGECWSRISSAAQNTFNRVAAPSYNIVYAVAKGDAAKVTYGPVITVKPKG